MLIPSKNQDDDKIDDYDVGDDNIDDDDAEKDDYVTSYFCPRRVCWSFTKGSHVGKSNYTTKVSVMVMIIHYMYIVQQWYYHW